MGRELRPRNPRPSYASMLQFDDDEAAGLSQQPAHEDEVDSGSEFALEEKASLPDLDETLSADTENDDEKHGLLDDDIHEDSLAMSVGVDVSNRGKGKRKSKSKKSDGDAWKMPASFTPGLLRPANRQMYALPNPSVHHRHRAVPLFSRTGKVERLEQSPVPFGSVKVKPTNNFTYSPSVTERMNKAWGYNVGSGPLWDLMEDRSAYKEAIEEESREEEEGNRRPRVYDAVRVRSNWEILDPEGASPYLPTDVVTTEEGSLKPPPPVICSFGPFGRQIRTETKMFGTINLSKFIPESKSHVFNAGAPVWGLDWCPIHPDSRSYNSYKHYLAVAPSPSQSYAPEIGIRVNGPSPACVQIWALRPTRQADLNENPTSGTQKAEAFDEDHGEMCCEIVLCLEGGPAHEIKWCPLPSHDLLSGSEDANSPRKLGLLAGTFEDGSLSVYAVPHPLDITAASHDACRPVFVRLPEPLLRIQLEEASCWALDWANSEVLAVGCTNGAIAVYDIAQALRTGDGPNIFPTHYIPVHQSAIRALAWIRAPPSSPSGTPMTSEDPTIIASGGYDGVECLTDIREPHGNVMNRTRDVINCLAYSPYSGGPITIDHENIVKAYSVSPSMLGRGHTLLDPSGPVWSVGASDYHPQLAVGAADGTCSTTNTLRFTRRGGSVPFFVCKVYQLDYSRNSGEFRMLERFLPQELQDHSGQTRSQRDKQDLQSGTGVWPREVGINCVVWNNGGGLTGAPLLASATAAGLCRIDWLLGRWMKERKPYGSILTIRREVDGRDDEGDSAD